MKKFFKFIQAEPWALLSTPIAILFGYLTIDELGGKWYLFAVSIILSIYSYPILKKWFKKK